MTLQTNNSLQYNECKLQVKIKDTQVEALLDSGANHSIVGPSLFKRLPELKELLQPIHLKVSARAVNGSTITYNKEIALEINIQDFKYNIVAYYSPLLPYNVVLGYDFLKKAKMTINFGAMSVQPQQIYVLRATKDIIIEPQTEIVTWGQLAGRLSTGLAILTTHKTIGQMGFSVAHALVSISQDKPWVSIRILNTYPTKRTIAQGTRIATAERLSIATQIMEPEENPTKAVNSSRANQQRVRFKPPEDFCDTFDLTNSTFNSQQKDELLCLLWEYSDIFLKKGDKLGCTDVLDFEIKLKDGARPFKASPYRSNPKLRKEISQQVKEMLDDDIIRPSVSPYGSPVLLVSKPDGSYRMVIDYRYLNSQTVVDNFPMIRISDSLESLGSSKAKYFSTLDLQSGYHQVPIAESSKQYTAFVTHDGLYEFNRMSFGLTNAPACFSRLMTRVLQNLNWEIALLYLDDIIVFSKDFEDHMTNLQAIFQRLRKANLTLKPTKCVFGREKIKFLGHIVSAAGIEPLPDKCQAVQEFPTPRKVRDVRAFLGLVGYYRKYIKDYSKIAAPLTDLTKKEIPFQWSDPCEAAFQTLKKKLTEAPILAYPDYNSDYILYTDASSEAIGMVLSQIQDGQEKVISYGGKKLSPAERKFGTTERECLAVIVAIKHFEPYLRGVHVTIVTDHVALKWILSQKQPKGRVARWVAYLQQFNYTVRHLPGNKLGNADGLSRRDYDLNSEDMLETSESYESHIDKDLDKRIFLNYDPATEKTANVAPIVFKGRRTKLKGQRTAQELNPVILLPELSWTKDIVKKCQLKDKFAGAMLTYLENGTLPGDKRDKEIILSSDHYFIEDNILYHLLDRRVNNPKRQIEEIRACLVIPEELKFDVLTSVHGDLSSGHHGTQKTYSTLRLKFYWKGMYKDCKNFVISCTKCNTRKNPVSPTKAPLQPLKPARVNERWAMDIVHMPISTRGNKYILTFTEYSTRYVEAFPIQNTQAITIAGILVNEICFRYSAPQQLLSDLGSNFISEVVKETCKLLGVERLYTSPYHPQTDGLLEKFHSTLKKNLSMYVARDHKNWDLFVRAVCYGYNTSVCIDSTQYSPFYLMFGREPFSPLDTILPAVQDLPNSIRQYALQLAYAREVAKNNVATCQEKIKTRYDETSNNVSFEPGELVWIFFPEINVGGSPKLFHNWSGPYLLMEKISPTNFKVVQAHDLKPLKNPVHVNRMKRFHHRAVVPPLPQDLQSLQSTESNDIQDLYPVDRSRLLDMSQSQPVTISRGNTDAYNRQELDHLIDVEVGDSPVPSSEASAHDQQHDTSAVYEINKIIKGRYNKAGKLEYLIDWKGYPASARTYEPEENLNDAAKNYVRTHEINIVGKKPNH